MSGHSPLPWQIKHRWDAEGATTIVANVDGETHADGTKSYSYDTIARCEDEFGERLDSAAANAAIIVKAVNSHAELVGALRKAVERQGFSNAELIEARAALKKAGAA